MSFFMLTVASALSAPQSACFATAVENGSILKISQTDKMKPAAASHSGRSNESMPLNEKPFLAYPHCSVTILVANDARHHLQTHMHALKSILTEFGVQRALWIAQVGFDEELLCRGGGYVQEVLITVREDVKIKGEDLMVQNIGKVLSPFPGIVRMPRRFFRTPVFKCDGSVWEIYDNFVRDHVKTLDQFEYDSARRLHMASSHEDEGLPADHANESPRENEPSKTENISTVNTSNGGSAHTTGGGNRSEKAKGKRLERTEQEEFRDGPDDSHDSDPHAGTSLSPRPRIKFEIITKVMGEGLRENFKIAGTFAFKVCFFFSIILMSPISVSFFGIIGATKVGGKPVCHIKSRVLVC